MYLEEMCPDPGDDAPTRTIARRTSAFFGRLEVAVIFEVVLGLQCRSRRMIDLGDDCAPRSRAPGSTILAFTPGNGLDM